MQLRPQFLEVTRGNSETLVIALTGEDGAPFAVTEDHVLVSSAKFRTSDPNSAAVFAWGTFDPSAAAAYVPNWITPKRITVTNPEAGLISVEALPEETRSLPPGTALVFDVRALNLADWSSTTVARGSIVVRDATTRLTQVSVPVRSGS